ncbi:MAG: GntR family transcriptional regulator [Gammaproteobacteria bacterium]|nr:GntR family transcriptional regulator [Gammaproteobacteria bacterium]
MNKPQTAAGRRKLGSGERSVTPLYHQMYLVLRQKIGDGEFDPEKPLPGEHQLAEQFGVSRVTVRRTLDMLELEGLIERRQGVGTFPVEQPTEFRDRYNIGGLTAPEVRTGARAEVSTLDIGRVLPPATVAARFGADAQQVLRVVRVRSFKGEPFTVMTSYIAMRYGERMSRRQLQGTAIPTALLELGAELARAEQAISATLADDLAASRLGVPVGSPLILRTPMFTDRRDEPVAFIEALYRPDRYEYRTTMLRRGSGKAWRWQPVY